MPPMHQGAPGLFEREGFLDDAIDVTAAQPLVAQLRAAVEVDGRDDPHVGLAPLAAAVGHLAFEQLERVESQIRLGDL